jgi:hypothetical protein
LFFIESPVAAASLPPLEKGEVGLPYGKPGGDHVARE